MKSNKKIEIPVTQFVDHYQLCCDRCKKTSEFMRADYVALPLGPLPTDGWSKLFTFTVGNEYHFCPVCTNEILDGK